MCEGVLDIKCLPYTVVEVFVRMQYLSSGEGHLLRSDSSASFSHEDDENKLSPH